MVLETIFYKKARFLFCYFLKILYNMNKYSKKNTNTKTKKNKKE